MRQEPDEFTKVIFVIPESIQAIKIRPQISIGPYKSKVSKWIKEGVGILFGYKCKMKSIFW